MNIPSLNQEDQDNQEEFQPAYEPFSGAEKNPSNWTLTPLEAAEDDAVEVYVCHCSATSREEVMSMENFNKLLRG